MLKRFVKKHLPRTEGDFEFPLRQPYDLHYFLLSLILAPAFLTAFLAFIIGRLIFPHTGLAFTFGISCAHFAALIIFLALLWLPVVLAIFNLPERTEMNIIRGRTLGLLILLLALFPHGLFVEFLHDRTQIQLVKIIYWGIAIGLVAVFWLISNYAHGHTAFRDVRMALSPEKRTRSERHSWFDTITIFMVFFAVIVIEAWSMATMSKGELGASPYEVFSLRSRRQAERFTLHKARKDIAQLTQLTPVVAYAHLADTSRTDTSAVESPSEPALQEQLRANDSLARTRRSEISSPDTAKTATPSEAVFPQELPKWMRLFVPDTSDLPLKNFVATDNLGRVAAVDEIDLEAAVKGQVDLRHRMYRLAWLASLALCALFFFLSACLPNRLMYATLIPVTFHEQDLKGIFFKAHRYLYHFGLAMLLLNPMLILGGLLITVIFLGSPAVFCASGRFNFLDNLAQADEIILVLGVFLAWFIPLARSVVNPDETFGEYFNRRLADHMMMVQGHIVFIGYGELGKRVLDREVNRLQSFFDDEQMSPGRAFKKLLGKLAASVYTRKAVATEAQSALREKHKRAFFEVVTPDLRLEYLCGQAVVIDRSSTEAIYSGGNSLLGQYGVVATCRRMYKSKDLHRKITHPEKRLLVPMIVGEAKEPFISSRVNLERASLLISMVPDEESVQAVFERAIKTEVPSIICVTRSDQISYLTYRSRHHPVILVYPKHNQGITLGERLWAAIIKVRSVRGMAENEWPRILVAGNHKANHYMMEKLWTNLPGSHNERVQIVKERFAFIVTAVEEEQEHPVLKDAFVGANKEAEEKSEAKPPKSFNAFDQGWPATYITGSRYPYPPPSQNEPMEAFRVPSRLINTADIRALQDCLEQHSPDILVINHVEAEKSLFMLSRCMRALERIKSRKREQFKLPFLMLAAARGDEWERLSMGDASLYYDALCHIYKDDLSGNLTYPQHARYDHFQRTQIGESIIDSLADVEEMIAGARATLIDPREPVVAENDGAVFQNTPPKAEFIEVHGCLPNRPGALANYISQLSGIEFKTFPQPELERHWRKINALGEQEKALLPSYQYLRYVTLDPETSRFALSGYASLAPIVDDSLLFAWSNVPQITRVFANDGRNYVEREPDPDASAFSPIKDLPEKILKSIPEPKAPGVPQVLDRLTARGEQKHNSVADFHEILLDTKTEGTHACPGMNICSIAAFQDYVVASNSLRLQRHVANPQQQNEKLLHARNYHCCAHMPPPQNQEKLHPQSFYARFFCCSQGKDEPGVLALVLNALLFRSEFKKTLAVPEQDDWVINIKYFKDVTCQNNHFTLNRLFGAFANKPHNGHEQPALPVQLLRILPIGGAASARSWYHYARALHAFLNTVPYQPRYLFYWLDEKRKTRNVEEQPAFEEDPCRDYPIVLVLEREGMREQREHARKAAPGKFCDLCGVQDKVYDCRELCVWV